MSGLNFKYNPITICILIINVVQFFLVEALRSMAHISLFALQTDRWTHFPTSLALWPLISLGSPLWILCSGGLVAVFVGSVERSWGVKQTGVFLATTTLISSVCLVIGSKLMHIEAGLSGMLSFAAPAVIVWACLNRRETVMLYGVIRTPAAFVAGFVLVLAWYSVGTPVIGLFPLLGSAFAYWYAMQGRSKFSFSGPGSRAFENIVKVQRIKTGLIGQGHEDLPETTRLNPISRAIKTWRDKRRLAKFLNSADNDFRKK